MPLDFSRYIHDPDRSPYHVLRPSSACLELAVRAEHWPHYSDFGASETMTS